MKTVVGVFATQKEAANAAYRLRSLPLEERSIHLVAPGDDALALVPHTDTEQPGTGAAVGGAVGAAIGSSMGAMATTALLPGVGPIVAIGIGGAALLAGIVGGAEVGAKLEGRIEGVPVDEVHLYESALGRGRSLVFATVEDGRTGEAQQLMQSCGASLDAAREAWWVGLRDAEAADYRTSGGDFVRNVKQLIDLLRQLADVAPLADTRQAAASAHERLFRGVVAASAAVDVDVDDEQ